MTPSHVQGRLGIQSLAGQPLSISTFTMEGETRQLPVSDTITVFTTERILGGLLSIVHPANLSKEPLVNACWYKGYFDVVCGLWR